MSGRRAETRVGCGTYMCATDLQLEHKIPRQLQPYLAGLAEDAAAKDDGLDGLHADFAASSLSW